MKAMDGAINVTDSGKDAPVLLISVTQRCEGCFVDLGPGAREHHTLIARARMR
jgi:hypothetical protein